MHPTRAPEFDLLILGGGCAGLSLARELAACGSRCPTTCILEQRAHYENDRTWCFWGSDGAFGSDLVAHEWTRVKLRHSHETVGFDCAAHPYRMIRGDRFYADALAKLSCTPRVTIEKAVRVVSAPEYYGGLWRVETDAGVRSARRLVDTRPHQGAAGRVAEPILWQSFLGAEIICSAPVFDAGEATLMDFIESDDDRVVFCYVLPLTAQRALVELTVFARDPVPPADLRVQLQQQLQMQTRPHAFTVERTEQGLLPMGLALRKRPARRDYLLAGLMHGGARASSGYAFQRIQKWATVCARQIIASVPMETHQADPAFIRAMDRLFLSLLRHQPNSAPALFLPIFDRCDPGALVRFLSDEASLGDALAVVRSLPALPFLRQIGRSLVPAW